MNILPTGIGPSDPNLIQGLGGRVQEGGAVEGSCSGSLPGFNGSARANTSIRVYFGGPVVRAKDLEDELTIGYASGMLGCFEGIAEGSVSIAKSGGAMGGNVGKSSALSGAIGWAGGGLVAMGGAALADSTAEDEDLVLIALMTELQ